MLSAEKASGIVLPFLLSKLILVLNNRVSVGVSSVMSSSLTLHHAESCCLTALYCN